MRRDPLELGRHALLRRRGDDERAGRAVAVEHEHPPCREAGQVERLGAQQTGLLAGGEDELDVARGRLGDERAGEHQQDGDGRLVVGAEHRGAVAAHEPVVDDHARRARDRHGVEVGAQADGLRLPSAGDAGDQVAAAAAGDGSAAVLADAETKAAEMRRDGVGDLPLGAGRRRDPGQPDEGVEELPVYAGAHTSSSSSSRSLRRRAAAPTKSRKSGAGRVGRDLNSGWNWEATNQG